MTTRYFFESVKADYKALWAKMSVVKTGAATAQAKTIIKYKARYQAVEKLTRDTGGPGVPWFVIGALHMRESNGDFSTWLHNGDPMKNRAGEPVQTVHVPAGRPPDPAVSWEDGAYDALVTCEQLDAITAWGPEHVAYAAEKFNGFGYRSPSRNIPSPYLWGGTSVQKRGKFVRDGHYDASVMDNQIGVMAVLKMVMKLDKDARFIEAKAGTDEATAPPPVLPPDAAPPLSPAATDTEESVKPLAKSKTIWGGIIGSLSGFGGVLAALFQHLNNPYTLAAFLVVVVGIAVGFFLVIKGRIDVNAIVEHLTDDTPETEAG